MISDADLLLLQAVGYDVQVKHSSVFLMPPYTHLVVVRHSSDDYMSIMLTPIANYPSEWSSLMASLLSAVPEQIRALGTVLAYMGGYHDEPLLEHIRIAKEEAIVRGHFDKAADLRDQERKWQREHTR